MAEIKPIGLYNEGEDTQNHNVFSSGDTIPTSNIPIARFISSDEHNILRLKKQRIFAPHCCEGKYDPNPLDLHEADSCEKPTDCTRALWKVHVKSGGSYLDPGGTNDTASRIEQRERATAFQALSMVKNSFQTAQGSSHSTPELLEVSSATSADPELAVVNAEIADDSGSKRTDVTLIRTAVTTRTEIDSSTNPERPDGYWEIYTKGEPAQTYRGIADSGEAACFTRVSFETLTEQEKKIYERFGYDHLGLYTRVIYPCVATADWIDYSRNTPSGTGG